MANLNQQFKLAEDCTEPPFNRTNLTNRVLIQQYDESTSATVSYTHLDVYKRQAICLPVMIKLVFNVPATLPCAKIAQLVLFCLVLVVFAQSINITT